MTAALPATEDIAVGARPDEVRRLGAGIAAYAEDLRATRLQVGGVLRRIGDWRGAAADACHHRLAATIHGLAACETAGVGAAAALHAYGEQLACAQETAGFAGRLRVDADKLTAGWVARRAYATGVDPTMLAAGPDPGDGIRTQAQALLAAAVEAQAMAIRPAVAEVEAAKAVLSRYATWRRSGELVAWVGRDVRDGLGRGVSELVDTAGWLARLPLHPLDDASGVGTSLRWSVTHPLAAAKELVGWEDLTGGHPARAVAQAVPGLVTTRGLSKGMALLRERHGLDPHWPALPDIPQGPVLTLTGFLGGVAAIRRIAHGTAAGHAWTKHQAQWRKRGVNSPEELAAKIELALHTPTYWFRMVQGQAAVWSDQERAFVVYNPNPAHQSTAYPITNGWKECLSKIRQYFEKDPSLGDDYEPDDPAGAP